MKASVNPRVAELFEIIKSAQSELERLRKECSHTYYEVGYWAWAPGHTNTCRICFECHGVVPGITDEETREFAAKQPKPQSSRHQNHQNNIEQLIVIHKNLCSTPIIHC